MERDSIVIPSPTVGPTTFVAASMDGNVATFVNRTGGIPIGFEKISVQSRDPIDPVRGVYKIQAKVVLPVLEVTSPSTATGLQAAPTIAYKNEVHMEFLLSARSNNAARLRAMECIQEITNDLGFRAAVLSLDPLRV